MAGPEQSRSAEEIQGDVYRIIDRLNAELRDLAEVDDELAASAEELIAVCSTFQTQLHAASTIAAPSADALSEAAETGVETTGDVEQFDANTLLAVDMDIDDPNNPGLLSKFFLYLYLDEAYDNRTKASFTRLQNAILNRLSTGALFALLRKSTHGGQFMPQRVSSMRGIGQGSVKDILIPCLRHFGILDENNRVQMDRLQGFAQ